MKVDADLKKKGRALARFSGLWFVGAAVVMGSGILICARETDDYLIYANMLPAALLLGTGLGLIWLKAWCRKLALFLCVIWVLCVVLVLILFFGVGIPKWLSGMLDTDEVGILLLVVFMALAAAIPPMIALMDPATRIALPSAWERKMAEALALARQDKDQTSPSA